MSKRRRNPKGQGETADSTSGGPRLLVIAPARESAEQAELRKKLTGAAKRADLAVLKTIRLEQHRVASGEEKDRLFPLVTPADAAWMYSELHRYDVAVLVFGAGYVRRDPSALPARRRQLLTIERFVRYKAYYGFIRTPQDVSRHLEQFELALTVIGCNGPDDPRALPLHIFNCPQEWGGLDDAAEQRQFAQEHGTSGRRSDCEGIQWEKPKGQAARHGGPALRIARCALPQGFHWDVSPESSGTIYAPDAVWRLKQRSSYLNIYPDGYVRPTERSSGVTKVWPRSNR